MAHETKARAEAVLKEFTELADEFAGYVTALDQEKETRLSISSYLRDVESNLAAPVKVDPKGLSKWFPGAKEAVLEDGVRLTLRRGKKEVTCSVLELEPHAYCAVVEEVAAEVERLSAKAEAKRGAEVKPVLRAYARPTGETSEVFDWRNYELMLANTGGSARKVLFTLPDEESGGHGPMDLGTLETTTIPLGSLQVTGSESLKVRVSCEDEEGREYAGEVGLEPDSKAVRIFKLKALQQPPEG